MLLAEMGTDFSERCARKVSRGLQAQCVDELLVVRHWMTVTQAVCSVSVQSFQHYLEAGIVYHCRQQLQYLGTFPRFELLMTHLLLLVLLGRLLVRLPVHPRISEPAGESRCHKHENPTLGRPNF